MKHGEQMIAEWETTCFHQWPVPVPGSTPFNRQVLRELGVKPSDLSRTLEVNSLEAAALHKGLKVPTEEQLNLLATYTAVGSEDLVIPSLDEGTRILLRPSWKESG